MRESNPVPISSTKPPQFFQTVDIRPLGGKVDGEKLLVPTQEALSMITRYAEQLGLTLDQFLDKQSKKTSTNQTNSNSARPPVDIREFGRKK